MVVVSSNYWNNINFQVVSDLEETIKKKLETKKTKRFVVINQISIPKCLPRKFTEIMSASFMTEVFV